MAKIADNSTTIGCSKDARKFYSYHKSRKPCVVERDADHISTQKSSPNRSSEYPVVIMNDINTITHNEGSSKLKKKRKYDGDNLNMNLKYRAGENKKTGGFLKELPVSNNYNDNSVKCSLTENAFHTETKLISTQSTKPLSIENNPASTTSNCSFDRNLMQKLESKCPKNLYYHDDVFWTTNLYKKQKSFDSKSSEYDRSFGKYDKEVSDSKETGKTLSRTHSSCKDNDDLLSLSYGTSQFLSTNRKNKPSLQKENGQFNFDCLVEINAIHHIPNRTVISRDEFSMGKESNIPTGTEHMINTKTATPPTLLNECDDDINMGNRSNLSSTPLQNIPDTSISTDLSNSTPLSTPQVKCGTKISFDSGDEFSNIKLNEQSGQDEIVSCNSPVNFLSEDPIGDKYFDSSLSSTNTSFTSITNTSCEDCFDDTSKSKLIGREKANQDCKKSQIKLNMKKKSRLIQTNSIMNYFNVDPTKKKSLNPDKYNDDTDIEFIKEKKKNLPTRSELNSLFDLPVSPRLQSCAKGKKVAAKMRKSFKGSKKEQMYIDIGQKNFGHTKCPTCGMIYTKYQDDDEAQHAKFHQRVIEKLHIKKEWKNERTVQEFPDGRIIMIMNEDHPSHLKKLSEVKEIVDTELGFAAAQNIHPQAEQQAFLFLMARKIVGCAIAVPINKAYPVIPNSDAIVPGVPATSPASSWCCSMEPISALCGISRVWVFSHNRRQKIASRLIDCIRFNFLYGCVIPKEKIAFSDPTPNGRSFAEKYVGKKAILVFR